jgi:hypothetical protein
MTMKSGEILKRTLSGIFLIVPMAFAALVICLFMFGLSFPPTFAQLVLVGLGAASGFFIGFGIPQVTAAVWSFISLFTGGRGLI